MPHEERAAARVRRYWTRVALMAAMDDDRGAPGTAGHDVRRVPVADSSLWIHAGISAGVQPVLGSLVYRGARRPAGNTRRAWIVPLSIPLSTLFFTLFSTPLSTLLWTTALSAWCRDAVHVVVASRGPVD